jgi:hypothetical protein
MGGMLQGVGTAWLGTEQAQDDSRSAIRQGELEVASANYNARQLERKSTLDAAKTRLEGSQLIARQRTAYANSGVAVDSGTPLSVMANTRGINELDAATIENDGRRAAWGQKLMAEQSKENTQAKLRAAKRQQIGSILGGIGQFTGGALNAGSMFGGGG